MRDKIGVKTARMLLEIERSAVESLSWISGFNLSAVVGVKCKRQRANEEDYISRVDVISPSVCVIGMRRGKNSRTRWLTTFFLGSEGIGPVKRRTLEERKMK